MKVIRSLNSTELPLNKAVATVGNFDGVHIGHRKIFQKVVERASETGGTSLVITFHPHPLRVLAPDRGVKMLTPLDDKLTLIEASGIDVVVVINFNRDFASLEPEEFVRRILLEGLGVVHLFVGHNYRFGRDKRGDTILLRRLSKKYGFKVNVVRNLKVAGVPVSSSRIRHLLGWGRVYEAASLLGRAYSIKGRVIKGSGRGADLLGVPTANLQTEYEVIPKEGVYAVKVRVGRQIYDGVANIGKNPTFGLQEPSYEVHILDFSKDLLGEEIRVYFIERLRGERRFKGPEQLRTQILLDIERARGILKTKRINIYP